jgi:uncharacterized integral membrane protein
MIRIKTVFILIVVILFVIVLLQNQEPDHLHFLWLYFYIPKLTMLLTIAAVAFILGYLAGRLKRGKHSNNLNTLSNEDNDYIH